MTSVYSCSGCVGVHVGGGSAQLRVSSVPDARLRGRALGDRLLSCWRRGASMPKPSYNSPVQSFSLEVVNITPAASPEQVRWPSRHQ